MKLLNGGMKISVKETMKYVSALRNRFWPCVLAQILKMSNKKREKKKLSTSILIPMFYLWDCAANKKISHETRNVECLFPKNAKN